MRHALLVTWLLIVLAWLLMVGGAATAHAQVFFASNTKPPFKVGPVYVRALISPTLGDVTVNVFFGLDLPPEMDTSAIEQRSGERRVGKEGEARRWEGQCTKHEREIQ